MARKTATALMNTLALVALAAMTLPSIPVLRATSHGAEDAKAGAYTRPLFSST
jgi:hypothetical protein